MQLQYSFSSTSSSTNSVLRNIFLLKIDRMSETLLSPYATSKDIPNCVSVIIPLNFWRQNTFPAIFSFLSQKLYLSPDQRIFLIVQVIFDDDVRKWVIFNQH